MSPRVTEPEAFHLGGPLPTGVTVLEASAGTGKTFTIAALAARYVAEGTPLEEILLVTFTRMATGELRDRVRERLVHTEQGLARFRDGVLPTDGDEVVALLARGSEEEVRERHERLARAIARFDAATIATTHGFCQEVLGGLGIVGDVETDMTFVEDPADLVEEVVDDLFVRRFHRDGKPQFSRAEALHIARIAIANPAARIEPENAPEHSIAAMRVRFARVVCEEFERRKRRMALITYEDLLTRLQDTLSGPGGEAAAERLRARYRVVLVDEFQDTDPVQWDIMRLAFGGGGVSLILIGDPKQAIYAFRGADVYAYLKAAAAADAEATLATNWRSDQGLIDAYDALFGGATLGHRGIVYRRVVASAANQEPGLSAAPVVAPVRVRVVHRDEPSVLRTKGGGYVSAPSAREHIAADLAGDLVALLSSGATVEIRSSDGPPRLEPVRAGHVAVLVRTHRNAALVRDALDRAGIPAVINGAGSVFGTVPARDWLRVLEAIERPASSVRARSAALTPFLGWTAARVAGAGEAEWEEVHRRLHRWGRVLRTSGVAALMETITRAEGLPGRVLSGLDGERRLTDLRHVGQLLHAEATASQLGGAALTAWLRQRIAAAARETSDEERTRRLESDAEAVQVLTIHRSKGLEFPVVYCPDLWEPGYIPRDPQPVFFHDPAHDDARTIDVGLDGPDWGRHVRHHEEEQRGEDLRLAYVALTRARHQAVVWWAGTWESRHSALGRLLFARGDDGVVPPSGAPTPTDAVAVARFEELALAVPGCISVERSRLGAPASWRPALPVASELAAASFSRGLDERWRRTSFSDISAGAYEASVGSEPEVEDLLADEPAVAAVALAEPVVDGSPLAAPVALAAMPAGVQVGTLVHRVLEATDFASPDLEAEVAARIADGRGWRHVDLGSVEVVAGGLTAALRTPLGPLLDGASLCDFGRADRLDELDFELPLVGGDEPTGRLTLRAIAAVLRDHLPVDDPLFDYATRLEDPALRPSVRGYLTGSIDLVLRVRGSGGGGAARYAIADYKTNWLAPPGEELTAHHHRPAALASEMRHRHYGLQALLYTVALHRYLRWRVPGYAADRHIAGVAYLFLRGMTGPETPTVDGQPCGVFAWRPPGALIEALSDVFDAGDPR
ncbi:MAG: UvrD-helicase domain-containing protein [Solirubrobacteraceae bacterium]|nr:UvrD-helicase domain-containing protein [Solirubrobacteraceae bacterium]